MRKLDEHVAWCDERIAANAKDNPVVTKPATLQGIGPIAAVATVGDFKQFRHGAQLGAQIRSGTAILITFPAVCLPPVAIGAALT